MSDTTNSGNPSVSKTLSTTINYSVTTVSFDVLKTDTTNSVQFNSRIDFGRASDGVKIFDVALSTNGSSLLVRNLRNGSSTNVQSFTDSAVSPVLTSVAGTISNIVLMTRTTAQSSTSTTHSFWITAELSISATGALA